MLTLKPKILTNFDLKVKKRCLIYHLLLNKLIKLLKLSGTGTDFTLNLLGSQWFLLDHHPEREDGHEGTVTGVAEHHGEQKGERDDGELGRIHFAVGGHSVSVDQVLETGREFIRAIVRRRHFARRHSIQNRRHRATTSFLFNSTVEQTIMLIKRLNQVRY